MNNHIGKMKISTDMIQLGKWALCFIMVLILSSVQAANTTPENSLFNNNEEGVAMEVGQQVFAGDFIMKVKFLEWSSSFGNKGLGEIYIPFLDQSIKVSFDNALINREGRLFNGKIRAKKKIEISDLILTINPSLSIVNKMGSQELPLDITSRLMKQDINLAKKMGVELTEFILDESGATVDLSIVTETITEGDYAYFTSKNVEANALGISWEMVKPTLDNDFTFDDFELPIRIKKYDPTIQDSTGMSGSYITFDCDGFKNFNLEAEYVFDRDQVVPANPQNSEDEVVATFIINSPSMGDFIVSATIEPFMIAGVDGTIFIAENAYIDYSDSTNPPEFNYEDPETESTPEVSWKGFYMKKLGVGLPGSVSSFSQDSLNGIFAEDIVYDRGNGISLSVEATDILSLNDGNLQGWGISIDTLKLRVAYNSLEEFSLNGDLYIPITNQGENIGYKASFSQDTSGNPQAQFVLNLGATYTIPFLNDAELTMDSSSVAGVRYSNDGFEPFTDLSGKLNLSVGGVGSNIPEINFPELGFQNLKLNDIQMALADASSAVQGEVTGGIDKMSIAAFTLGGQTYDIDNGTDTSTNSTSTDIVETEQDTGTNEAQDTTSQQDLGGFPISIKSWKFESVQDSISGESLKKLSAELSLNFTSSSGGGLTGQADLGVKAKIEYAKLMSLTPWKALDYRGTDVGSIVLEGEFGPATIAGSLTFIDDDPIYGYGLKGAVNLSIDSGASSIQVQSVAQFGTTSYEHNKSYRYFFVDAQAAFTPGIAFTGFSMYGFGGGVYYNMTKNLVPIGDGDNASVTSIDPTPGVSLSGALYTPSVNKIGINASVIIGDMVDPTKLSGDLTFGILMNTQTLGIEEISLSGNMYAMSESLVKREQAPVKANASLVVNLNDAVLTGVLGYDVRYPEDDPFIEGSGQGAFQVDLDLDDNKEHKNYFVMGSPSNPFDLNFKLTDGVLLNMQGYIMIGDSIEAARPLSEISPLLANFDSPSQGNAQIPQPQSGIAFGYRATLPQISVSGGPFYADLNATMGMDASFANYGDFECGNSSGVIGLEGWYLKARIYMALQMKLGMEVDVWFYEGDVDILDATVAAALQAELPNPTWLKGDLEVKASLLGGTLDIDTDFEFEIGEKCQTNSAAAMALGGIKAITDTQPVDDATDFEIYHEPRAAFSYMAGDNPSDIPPLEERFRVVPKEDQVLEFFPYITELSLVKVSDNSPVSFTRVWNSDKNVLAVRPHSVLEPYTEYKYIIAARWRFREYDDDWTNWEDVLDDDGNALEERYEIDITTKGFPDKIVSGMLNSDRHMPGNGQRNFTSNFAKTEIQFKQEGFEGMFDAIKEKDFNGDMVQVEYDYTIRLTKIIDNTTFDIPISEFPGDAQYTDYVLKTGTYSVFGTPYQYEYWEEEMVNSKELKYHDLNDPNKLEKNTIYKLQILGIPKPEQGNNDLNSDIDSTIIATGVEGVQIQAVTNTLTSQSASPYKDNDILYEYHFKTSKYNSLKEKLENLEYIGQEYGAWHNGSGYPGSETAIIGRDGQFGEDTRTDYHTYKLSDEAFDQWDRDRIRRNTKAEYISSDTHPFWYYLFDYTTTNKERYCHDCKYCGCWLCGCDEYRYNDPSKSRYEYMMDNYRDSKWKLWLFFQADGLNTNQTDMIYFFDKYLDKNAWKQKGWYYDIAFPNKDASTFNDGVLKLTETEKQTGVVQDQWSQTGYSDNGQKNDLNSNSGWELAFVSNRKRVNMKQYWHLSVMGWLMSKYNDVTRKDGSWYNVGGWADEDPINECGTEEWFWDEAGEAFVDYSHKLQFNAYSCSMQPKTENGQPVKDMWGNLQFEQQPITKNHQFKFFFKSQWDLQDEDATSSSEYISIPYTEDLKAY